MRKLIVLAAAALLAPLLASCKPAPQPTAEVVLTYASPYPPGHPFSKADSDWMRHVEQASGGRIAFKPYWSGALLSSDMSMVEIRHGLADIGLITPIYARGGAHMLRAQSGFYGGVKSLQDQVAVYDCLAAQFPQFGKETEGLHVLAVQGGNFPGVLTRARPVFGSAAARARLQADIDDVLMADRDVAVLMADVVKMRGDMARHKPAKGPLDVKLGDGGLVDAEFAIHAQQLRHRAAFDTRLDVALDALVAAGLAPPETMPALALLTRMLVTLRLMAPDGDAPADDATRQRIATACLGKDATWDVLLARHASARKTMSDWWAAIRDGGPGPALSPGQG